MIVRQVSKYWLEDMAEMTDSISRRTWLHCAGLSYLSGGALQAWGKEESEENRLRLFGQAKSCVVLFLFGGPGQQDLWDMKPMAPAEVRGEFKPISTSVPGTQIGEYLPRLSKLADKYTIVRSMSHRDFEHGSASYTALTGHPHPKPGTNTPASKDDFPTYGAAVAQLKPTPNPVPSAAVLGPVMHQGNRPPMAGQNAGFLGEAFDPFRVAQDPNGAEFQIEELALPSDISSGRLADRFELLQSIEQRLPADGHDGSIRGMSNLKRRAFGLLGSQRSQQAFDLSVEADPLRDHYGRHKFGQTMLLARRLVEAEVPLITVNWARSNREEWDTHAKNYPTLKNKLLPPFDQGLAAFLADLDQRGLLDTTLVLALGEFGRTPKINKDAGRDHWPDVYSLVMAGGGIKRGVVVGASDRQAAFPLRDPIAPWDISATMYHLLGIAPRTHVYDRQGRPFLLSPGKVVSDLLA
jgi:hypothetical protein